MQKPILRRSRNFDDLGVDFCCFLVDLGSILMTFGALGTGLKFDDFPWPPGCAPEIRAWRKWTLKSAFWGPINQSDSIAADSM